MSICGCACTPPVGVDSEQPFNTSEPVFQVGDVIGDSFELVINFVYSLLTLFDARLNDAHTPNPKINAEQKESAERGNQTPGQLFSVRVIEALQYFSNSVWHLLTFRPRYTVLVFYWRIRRSELGKQGHGSGK